MSGRYDVGKILFTEQFVDQVAIICFFVGTNGLVRLSVGFHEKNGRYAGDFQYSGETLFFVGVNFIKIDFAFVFFS